MDAPEVDSVEALEALAADAAKMEFEMHLLVSKIKRECQDAECLLESLDKASAARLAAFFHIREALAGKIGRLERPSLYTSPIPGEP